VNGPHACDYCGSDEHSCEALRCGHCLSCGHLPDDCALLEVEVRERREELDAMVAARQHARGCACSECWILRLIV